MSGVLTAVAGGMNELSPRQVLKMTESEVVTADTQVVRGVVTFVSGIASNRFVIAPQEHVKSQGLAVKGNAGVSRPRVGDLVQIGGRVRSQTGQLWFEATRLDVVRNESLPEPRGAKQADYRRGILEGRRVSLTGTIREVRRYPNAAVPQTELSLFLDNYTTLVRVPGDLETKRYLGEPVHLNGLVHSVVSERGAYLDSWLEVAAEKDIELLRGVWSVKFLLAAAIFPAAVLSFIVVLFLVLLIRARRERRELAMIAAERRRMAADLHDTIEQHLAGANLLAAGVMALEDTPADVKDAMKTLTALLANAKAEVRSAVLNLRSASDSEKTLEERICEMAVSVEKTGVRVRRCLRGLPLSLPEGVYQDILLIVREATTNAIRHGHAKEVVYTAGPRIPQGFVLRVLNDGEPFAIDRTLGPETGHYGLSGMKERALRNHLSISWGTKGKWTYMELVAENL